MSFYRSLVPNVQRSAPWHAAQAAIRIEV